MVALESRSAYVRAVAGRLEWVLLGYRVPREPSTPRITVWRKLKRLGVAQVVDGLVALPLDARTKEQLEWLGDEIVEAGGEATIWTARLGSVRQERELAGRMAAAVAAEYQTLVDAAGDVASAPAPVRRRVGQRARGRRMRWATRSGCHVDRAACAWLIRRFLDADADFVFVDDPDEVPADATPFDMPGVELSHHGDDCTFETMLRRHDLDDPVLWEIAKAVHEADLADDRYDAPEAAGLDIMCRGLSMIVADEQVLAVTGPLFDGLYEYRRRALLLGRDPA
jgi:hypothetical protein